MALSVPETPAPSSQIIITDLWLNSNPCALGQGPLIPLGFAGTPLCQHPRAELLGKGLLQPTQEPGVPAGHVAPTSGSHL